MSDESNWKEKYLDGLEQLSAHEERWSGRVELLRRSLVRTSMAAEGLDPVVDACLDDLRELLRRDDLDESLAALVPRLEKAVLEADRRRDARLEAVAQSLRKLVDQLRLLPVHGEPRKALKRLGKRIGERAGQGRELEELLRELSALQAQAIQQALGESGERSGFLQRLFGTRNLIAAEQEATRAPQSAMAAVPADEGPAGTPGDVSAPPGVEVSPDVPGDDVPGDAAPSAAAPAAEAHDEPDAGPAYSQVAGRIQASLDALLDGLVLAGEHLAKAQALRERIHGGLNWYELVPVLDDLAGLLRGLSSEGREEFQRYLRQINQRLSLVQESLGEMGEGNAEQRQAAERLDSSLREQVGGLHEAVQQGTDLSELKQLVEARLGSLMQTVEHYQQERQRSEARMSERLAQLGERLTSMEQTAEGLREHLELQRRQALQDSLTGIANRAAWNERLALEVTRWQRYGGELQLAVMDIDHFKRINDSFGHAAGDRVLKIIAGKWQMRLRKTDFLARYGGEEFVLLLPGTGLLDARRILEELRTAIEGCPFHFKGERIQVTVSIGLTAFSGNDDAEKAFERADQALYRAKHAGRNRVELG